MKKTVSLAILFLFILSAFLLHSQERRVRVVSKEQRIALVIGNADYKNGPLRNPVNDAYDIAKVLKKKG